MRFILELTHKSSLTVNEKEENTFSNEQFLGLANYLASTLKEEKFAETAHELFDIISFFLKELKFPVHP
jgi:hypothetical protein